MRTICAGNCGRAATGTRVFLPGPSHPFGTKRHDVPWCGETDRGCTHRIDSRERIHDFVWYHNRPGTSTVAKEETSSMASELQKWVEPNGSPYIRVEGISKHAQRGDYWAPMGFHAHTAQTLEQQTASAHDYVARNAGNDVVYRVVKVVPENHITLIPYPVRWAVGVWVHVNDPNKREYNVEAVLPSGEAVTWWINNDGKKLASVETADAVKYYRRTQ